MWGLGLAPLTPLFELDLALHKLLILAAPVVYALALRADELYELFLRHGAQNTSYCTLNQESGTIPLCLALFSSFFSLP